MNDPKSPNKDRKNDNKYKKQIQDSSSSDSEEERSASDSEYELDKARKVIAKMFPSKYLKKK